MPLGKAAAGPIQPIYTSCAQYAALIERYAWDVHTALAVMKAESGCRADAVGDTTLTFIEDGEVRGMSCGLFQVRVLRGRPSCDFLQDPANNVAWAWKIYSARGNFGAWSAYTSGAYLNHM